MYGEYQENIFYYITTLNENYIHPSIPKDVEEGILKGIYKLESHEARDSFDIKLLGSGSILQQVRIAAKILADEYDISSEVYSVTSYNELAREGKELNRQAILNPQKEASISYIDKVLGSNEDNIIISTTDYMKSYSQQVSSYVKGTFQSLGTDGYGRSDSRENLRSFFLK